MSKSLRSFENEKVKLIVAHKRVQQDSGGLGFWRAKDALQKVKAAEEKK